MPVSPLNDAMPVKAHLKQRFTLLVQIVPEERLAAEGMPVPAPGGYLIGNFSMPT
jgi:hypothetical protein